MIIAIIIIIILIHDIIGYIVTFFNNITSLSTIYLFHIILIYRLQSSQLDLLQKWSITAIPGQELLNHYLPSLNHYLSSWQRLLRSAAFSPHRQHCKSLSLFPWQMFRSASVLSSTSSDLYSSHTQHYFHRVKASSFPLCFKYKKKVSVRQPFLKNYMVASLNNTIYPP